MLEFLCVFGLPVGLVIGFTIGVFVTVGDTSE